MTGGSRTTLDEFARDRLRALEVRDLKRSLKSSDRGPGMSLMRDGRRYVDFCSNDYLGFAHDPAIKQAAVEATLRYGAGAGASRLVTGNHPLYDALEARLASFKGTEAAIVFGSGYLANLGIVPALVGEGDLILVDELAHACLMSGSRLSGATAIRFRHNDMGDLARTLGRERARHRNCLILTDGVFSMDGDLAPLPEIMALADAHEAWLMTDDAHGLGVIGEGKGSAAHFGVMPHLQMGTLSKAVGSYGGYVCAARDVVDLILNRARSLIYSTGLPPSAVGAAVAALDRIAADRVLTRLPLAKARHFTRLAGLPEAQSPIVPLLIGSPDRALAASLALEAQGFIVTAIRPPTVPEGTARLRITFSATHDDADIARLAAGIAALELPKRAA